MLRTLLRILFILTITFFQVKLSAQDSSFELTSVVIDAGHGGKDPGTTIGNLKEKDIVLDVALMTGELIKKLHPEVQVIYTRDNDIFVPLDERANIANKQKADLFISIHVNYFKGESTLGAETYILGNHRSEENLKVAQMENAVILLEDDYTTRYEGFDPNSAESYIMFELIQNEYLEQSRFLADHIQKSFISTANRKSRGVRQAGFLVLRRTTMPSVLVELGFISNKTDQLFLCSTDGKQKLAQSIANAFTNYKSRVDSRSLNSKNTKTELIKPTFHNDTIITIQQTNTEGQWYAVQILASKVPLDITNSVFKNETPIYCYYEKEWYKYYVGLTRDAEKAILLQTQMATKFKGAFLVLFNNGQKEIYKIKSPEKK